MSTSYSADLTTPPTPIQGACHCRSFTFTLSHPPKTLTSCTCTFCSKRGVLWAYYPSSAVTIDSNTHDGCYANSPEIAKHHFCNKCGCGTFTEAVEWIKDEEKEGGWKVKDGDWRISVNGRLIEGDGFDVGKVEVQVIDGKNLW